MIYHTLELLQAIGLIRVTYFSGKHMCYEGANGQAHHHFVCRSCHYVQHLDPRLLMNLPEQLTQHYGISVLTLELVATGYFQACWLTLQQVLRRGITA